jgi:hypothetical protein
MAYIYKYENKINHHVYIGQTVDFKKRCREHKNASFNVNNKDYNCTIHRAIRKYGLENFEITILEECSSSIVNDREKHWIAFYNSYEQGYNETKGGQDGGYNGRQVNIYDLKGNYLKSYINAKEAALDLQVSYSTIQQVLHQKRPTCKKIQAKYTDDPRIITEFKSRQGGKIPIYQINKDNKNIIKEWESTACAAKELKLDASTITKCLKGKLKTCGGFEWRYK